MLSGFADLSRLFSAAAAMGGGAGGETCFYGSLSGGNGNAATASFLGPMLSQFAAAAALPLSSSSPLAFEVDYIIDC